MKRLIATVAASLLLHGIVLAALLPGDTAPPSALPTLSVEIVDGLPGETEAEPGDDPRPRGAAPARDSMPARRSDNPHPAETMVAEQAPAEAPDANPETVDAAVSRGEQRSRPADTARTSERRPTGDEPAETRPDTSEEERAETRRTRQTAARSEAARSEAAREPRTARTNRPAQQSRRPAGSRHNDDGQQLVASRQMPSGETVPPRYGVGSGANPLPDYPQTARYMGWEGTVVLRVRVRADGRSERVEIAESSGHASLDEAALQTVRDLWRFDPARQGRERIAATVLVPIRFRLDGS